MGVLRLLGQFAIVIAWGAVLICTIIAIWYGFSFVVLAAVGRLFPLRGSHTSNENGSTVSAPNREP